MTRFLPLLAALLFAGAATAQDTPTETMESDVMTAEADTTEPAITFNPERSRQLAAEGDALFGEKNYDGALEQYTLGLAYDSTYAKNPFGQARSYVQLRQLPQAVEAYRLAIELSNGVEGMSSITSAARTELSRIEETMVAQQSAQAIAENINRASAMLQSEPVSASAAETAYGLMEDARMAGYDSSLVAFFYAKALNIMERHDEALPYAELALAQSEGQPDRSGFYIQVGLAHWGAGDMDAAREAFSSTAGGAWEAWGTHYIGKMEKEAAAEAETEAAGDGATGG